MKVDIVKVGFLQTNCYILSIDNDVLVIDPGDEFDKIKSCIGNKNVLKVLLTHHHFDHVGALVDIINEYNVDVLDNSNLEEKEYEIGKFKFNVIFTKGHTSDSITYYFMEDKKMFVGDFIFKESIGRCDLPTGNTCDMKLSLRALSKFDDDIIIYPGHGEVTTIGYEKENNEYLTEKFSKNSPTSFKW